MAAAGHMAAGADLRGRRCVRGVAKRMVASLLLHDALPQSCLSAALAQPQCSLSAAHLRSPPPRAIIA
jgi:hypothetical protein